MNFLKSRRLALTAAALAVSAALPCTAWAQAWPAKPITWVVPFAAGGPTDALARHIADRVGRELKQARASCR